MANNQIMVSMKFQADTSQAKAKMQELQSSLKALQSLESSSLPLGKTVTGLEQAKNAAAQLQIQLQSAFNQDTGKLDLSRFNKSLKESNMSLQQYKNILLQAGPAGQQAFGQLAVQIASADTHVIRINSHVAKLGKTLANTFRWQISSAALMAVTSTISEAYSFAQDLNESLNNIRIVTGNSANEMARFAKEANNAAKALSTTTTRYTDASLIYFQQGLNEKQVKERTDLTIKMANVTGQSVAEVSDQLTAVWNNFDDGTKSLEHYVDVMTALGAVTASSSEEISEGLNKFAAVAETVGLSYEYAASALATVTATTRQSADVVGTAFKTLFARIQDLELGKTLDDGTTMGQYSQALAAVGINIKDVNGEVKDMNTILDEMGAKWNMLSKDAQIALAQNVAGVRQYTQLIALMDNWDFFQENLEVANESMGTLQEQADIYAESWEAARDKVTAALEDIYQDLLKDDVFIGILEFFAGLLENIDNVIESVGGLNGVLTILAAILMKVYQNSIAMSLSSMGTAMMSWTKAGQARINQTKEEAFNEATTIHKGPNASDKLANENIRNQINTEARYNELTTNASEQQKAILNIRKEQIQKQNEENEKLIEELRILEKITVELEEQTNKKKLNQSKSYYTTKNGSQVQTNTDWASLKTMSQQSGAQSIFNEQLQLGNYDDRIGSFLSGNYSEESLNRASDATEEITNKMQSLGFGAEGAEQQLKELFGEEVYQALEKYYQKVVETSQKISELKNNAQLRDKATQEVADIEDARHKIKGYNNKGGRLTKAIKNGTKDPKLAKEAKEYAELTAKVDAYDKKQKELIDTSDEVSKQISQHSQNLKNQTEATINAQGATDAATKRTRQFVEENKNLGTKAVEATVAVKGVKDGVKSLDTTMANTLGPVTLSQKLTTFASMAMSASMALQGFKSLVDTWNNEDISFGDKLIQTMMSLSMIIPAVTTVMNKQNLARLFGVNAMKKENGEWIFNTTQKGANTVATWLQKLAQDALNGSIAATIAMLAIFTITIVAVIAVIALLVNAFKGQKSALEKANEEYEKQNKLLQEAKERYSELTEEVKNLKEEISDYSDGLKALKDLVKGTDEYNNALEKVNESAKKLIEAHGLSRGIDFYTDSNGIIQIYDEALNKIEKAKEEAALLAELSVNQREVQTTKAEANVNKEKYNEFFAEQGYDLNYIKFFKKGDESKTALTKEELQQLKKDNNYDTSISDIALYDAGVVDAEQKDINEQDIEKLKEIITNKQEQRKSDWVSNEEYFTQIRSDFGEYLGVAAEDLEGLVNEGSVAAFENLIQATNETEKALQELSRETARIIADLTFDYEGLTKASGEKISEEEEGYIKTIAGNLLTNSSEYQELDKKYKGLTEELLKNVDDNDEMWELKEFLKSEENAEYAKEFANAYSKATGKTFNIDNITTQDMLKGYFEGQGYQNVTVQDENDKNIVTYIDANGEAQQLEFDNTTSQTMSAEWISSLIKQAELEEFAKQFEGISEQVMQELVTSTSSAYGGQDFTSAVTQAMSTMGTDAELFDFTSVLSELNQEEAKKLQGLSGSALLKAIGLTPKMLEDAGLNIEEFIQKAESAIDTQWDEKTYIKTQNQKGLKKAEELELNTDEFEAYRELLKSMYPEYQKNAKAANALAIANLRLERGVNNLNDNWDEFNNIMSSGTKDLYKMKSILPEINSAIADMLNMDDATFDLLPADFAEKNWELLQKVMAGEEGALAQFRETAAIALMESYDDISGLTENLLKALATKFNSTQFEVGVEINDKAFLQQCKNILSSSEMTAEQASAIFAAMGYEAEFVIDSTTQKVTGLKSIWASGAFNSDTLDTSIFGNQYKKDETRYHHIQEWLEDLERQYDKIGKAKDRAFGKTKLNYMEQEIAALSTLITKQQDYVNNINSNLQNDFKALDQWIDLKDVDESGRIKQEAIDRNKGNEEFNNFLEQYEETLNLYESEKEKLEDLANEKLDLQLEKIQAEVELEVSLVEDELNTLDYALSRLEDGIEDLAEALTIYGKQIEQYSKQTDAEIDGINKFMSEKGFSQEAITRFTNGEGLNPEDFEGIELSENDINYLRDAQNNLISYEKSVRESFKNVGESVVKAAEDFNDKLEKNSNSIKRYGEVSNGLIDIVDLLGGQIAGTDELISTLTATNVTSAKGAAEAAKILVKQAREDRDAAIAARDQAIADGASADVIEEWNKTIEILTENVEKAEDDWMSTISDGLQTLADAFESNMNQIFKTFEKTAAGTAGTFENLQAQFDRANEENNRYLQAYEKTYQLSKLSRDLTNSIDETDNVKAKQKLKELEEDLAALQEDGKEVSQYELDNLQAKYDLRLAEIALEEAQNAKSQVRMSRDSEGNWSYVYTADQDKVDEAQQNYEDKLYNIQKLQQDYIQQAQSELIQLESDRSAALQEIMNDTTLNAEEKKAKMEEINEYYNSKASYWNGQLGIVLGDAKKLYEDDMTNYANTTGQKLISTNEWVDNFGETIYAQKTGFTSLDEAYNQTAGKAGQLVEALTEAAQTYEADTKELMDKAGASIESVGDKADEAAGKMPTLLEAINNMANEASTKIGSKEDKDSLLGKMYQLTEVDVDPFANILENAKNSYNEYDSWMDKYAESNKKLISSITDIIAEYARLDQAKNMSNEGSPVNTTDLTEPKGDDVPGSKTYSFTANDAKNLSGETVAEAKNIFEEDILERVDVGNGVAWVRWQERDAQGKVIAEHEGFTDQLKGIPKTPQKNYKTELTTPSQDVYYDKYSSQTKIIKNDQYVQLSDRTWAKKEDVYNQDYWDDSQGSVSRGQIKLNPKEKIFYKLVELDTGGYTGEWDSSGRLAMLHQKEIVLNASDTENFLSAIGIVRDIAKIIDLQAASQQYALMSALTMSTATNGQTLQQEVTIHAEFPNATDRNEIEEAFKSLVNRASQFANRKI